MFNLINNDEIRNELEIFKEQSKTSEDEIICSIVYEFARKLPYSMDYMDKDFVPGVFLNISPKNPVKRSFKEYSNLYYKMIGWNDTKKSGILLQICTIFQAMIMGQLPDNFWLNEEDFENLGISQMTKDEEYNRFLFETLQMLPQYCVKLNLANDIEERRKILDDIYMVISDRIGQKIGGFKKTTIDGNVMSVDERKASIRLRPHKDLEMLYYFEGINIDYDVRKITNNINNNIIQTIDKNTKIMYLESEDNKLVQKK